MSKFKYKVRNWKRYNAGLKRRGAINIWISQDELEKWRYQGARKRGGQFVYSDEAIKVCLTVRKVYHLPLRQTAGFLESIFSLMHVELPVPDYSLICRRSRHLVVDIKRKKGKAVTDIVVDSTGLKVYGEGEWKVRMHGWGKHRTWMKLHVAVDAQTQQAQAVELSTNAVDDGAVVEKLLGQIKERINSFTADGGYDKTKVRKALQQRAAVQAEDILQVIAPQHNAIPDIKQKDYMKQRDEDIALMEMLGREQWKTLLDYHQRSKAETFMFRYKVILGGTLQAREFSRQQTEVKVSCNILNKMLDLAKPQSERVA